MCARIGCAGMTNRRILLRVSTGRGTLSYPKTGPKKAIRFHSTCLPRRGYVSIFCAP